MLSLLAILITSGCATTSPDGLPPVQESEIADLSRAISALGADVDPDEAALVARIAFGYAHQLASEYQVTDTPLIHNMKVNQGLRPRGLCYHWADDMEARLQQENFRTLTLHRAIANAGKLFRIDHSTVIISRRGETLFQGLVLDGWRDGGRLFWGAPLKDTSYEWRPREEVFEDKRRRRQARAQLAS